MMDIGAFERRFQSGLDAMASLPLHAARRRYDALCADFAPPLPEGMEIIDGAIGGVPVRRHRPRGRLPGTVVHIHGGGFELGSLDSHQGVAAGLAEALGREVIGVGYRLLPEARYADALEDCRRVIAATDPVALAGDSAGGRLLLDLAGGPDRTPPLGLIYPLAGTPTPASLGPGAPLLGRGEVLAAWAAIAADVPARDPARPPARHIEVLAVSRDPLTAPLERAVAAWRDGGAAVGYHLAEGMLHGCLHARHALPEMAAAWRAFCQALRARLDEPRAAASIRPEPHQQ